MAFEKQILADLIAEGVSGDDLLIEFKSRQSRIRSSVMAMLEEAKQVAQGNGEYYTYEEVFDEPESNRTRG